MTDSHWRADVPNNALPPLPPTVDLETKAVLKRCIMARAALGELKQAAELVPNQAMLINTLPLLEARASSEIENIVTTTDRLFQFQKAAANADPMTKEALRYSHALLEGFKALDKHPLNTRPPNRFAVRSRVWRCGYAKCPGQRWWRSRPARSFTRHPSARVCFEICSRTGKFLHGSGDLDRLYGWPWPTTNSRRFIPLRMETAALVAY